MTERISITRALVELKLLNARIEKKTNLMQLVDVFQQRSANTQRTGITTTAFEAAAGSSLQSVEDLIERRKKVKSAILISNATAMVNIDGVAYTVIEAIERKNSIGYEKSLLAVMRNQIVEAKSAIANQKPRLDATIEKLLSDSLGDRTPTNEDYDNVAKPFLVANEYKLLDPCGIETRIEQLDEKIDGFLAEVDFVLSESNSRTEIEI